MYRWKSVVLTFLVIAAACAAVVLATPGSGVSGIVHARGAFQTAVDIKVRVDEGSQEVIHVSDSKDTVVQQIVVEPRGHTGWHSHPGPAIALVKSGTLTLYDGDDPACLARNYSAGQAFIDSGQGHVHLGANLSATQPVEVWVTYLDVPPGASPRVDQPDPNNCPF